jgi:hypothetical protein
MVAVAATLTTLFVGAIAPGTADAYRSNNSNWTDNGNEAWSGLTGGYIKGSSSNSIRGTSWLTYCNLMTWKGYTKLYAPGASATTLTDYWSAGTPSSPSFSVPAGVSVSGSTDSATWATTLSGTTQTHSYSTYPITFQVGSLSWFYSVNHTASATRRVGSTSYNGPSYKHYEWVC